MPERPSVWLVSACLLGVECRYDGGTANEEARRRLAGLAGELVPICPEAAGGLPTPRPPAVLHGGDGHGVLDGGARVVAQGGQDVTAAFRKGAELAVAAASRWGAEGAILKARSPSCGCGRVHGPGGLIEGDGVAAAALKRAGLRVLTDEDA